MESTMQLAQRNQRTNFSMIRQDNAPKRISINPIDEKVSSVISANSRLEGNLSFADGLKIDGVIAGNVTFGTEDGLCILSKGARFEGSLFGPRAFILGEVEGDIEVQGTLVLAPSAVVVGKIRCGKFVVYDGASISGSIETIQSPTKQKLEQDAHEDARGVVKLKTGTR